VSTRGCIAIGTPESWLGLYNHSDSYPTGLGAEVWNNMQAAIHKDGIEAAMHEVSQRVNDAARGGYEHNDFMDNKAASPLFIEWVYIIDDETKVMHVLASRKRNPDPKHPNALDAEIRLGGEKWEHFLIDTVPLDGPEPDWAAMQNKRYPEEKTA
jgi:hypothetical protein